MPARKYATLEEAAEANRQKARESYYRWRALNPQKRPHKIYATLEEAAEANRRHSRERYWRLKAEREKMKEENAVVNNC